MSTPTFDPTSFSSMFGVKKKVLVRGPVLTQSGYGVHARQVAKWLLDNQNLDVLFQALPWGDTPWLIDGDICDGLIAKIMEKTVDPTNSFYDASVQIQLPNEWDPRLAKFNVGVTAGVETDKCNPEWIAACNRMSMIIVPSEHTKRNLTNTGEVKVPILVIPESYSPAIDKAVKTSIDEMTFSTPFNFLVFGQLTGNNPENDRKNLFYTIKWFCEVFKDDPDVGLVIKTNAGRNTKLDRRVVKQMLQQLLSEVRKDGSPKVHLLHGDMSDEEVASLYRHPQIKAMISLTRGEGYGLPILEAAASGLPIIATAWSGHMDFMKHGKFIEVAYRLDKIHPSRVDNKIFMQDSRWAHPNEDDFKKRVMKFRSSFNVPKEWAEALKSEIVSRYSQTAVEKVYDESLKDKIA
jgi:glycosyltransferase involved in cell wall biosynthesis